MTEIKEKIFDEVMETPKVSWALGFIGFLIILYSFITIQTPAFLIVGIYIGLSIMYFGYSYWHKKLTDKKIEHLSIRFDSFVHPPQ